LTYRAQLRRKPNSPSITATVPFIGISGRAATLIITHEVCVWFQLLASLWCSWFWDNILNATERPRLVGRISSKVYPGVVTLVSISITSTAVYSWWLGYAQRTSSRKCKTCRRAAVIYKRLGCCIATVQHKATQGVS